MSALRKLDPRYNREVGGPVLVQKKNGSNSKDGTRGVVVEFEREVPIRVGTREYSRGEISRGTGLSMGHISRIFSGKRLPSLRTALDLAWFFEITVDDLFKVLDIRRETVTSDQTQHDQATI